MVFDVTRKSSYQNLKHWYQMLKKYSGNIPVILVANKVDIKPEITKKKFKFSEKFKIPLYFTSAANGVNVVRVFDDILKMSIDHKKKGNNHFVKNVLEAIESDDEDVFA